MINLFKKIFQILHKKDKKYFIFVCVLTLVAAVLETISLGSFIPLIEQFSKTETTPTLEVIYDIFNISGESNFETLKILTGLIILIFFVKSVFAAFYLWHQSKFVHAAKVNISSSLFENYINQKYLFHVNKNSSKLITNINIEVAIFSNVLMFLIKLFVQLFVAIGIVTLLFYVNKKIAILLFISSIVFAIFLYSVNKKRFEALGTSRIKLEEFQNKSLFESFGAIKEVILFNIQKLFYDNFHTNISKTANTQRRFTFVNNLTRIWYEVFLIFSMVLIILYMTLSGDDNSTIMATLGFYLLAALRLVPSLNEISTGYNYIKFASPTIKLITEDINLNKNTNASIKFSNNEKLYLKDSIEFKNINFSFLNSKPTLTNVNFKIFKNDFIAIIGETGSGKSTVCDLITGLVKPNSGDIIIDSKKVNLEDERWKNNIGYVPQKIYLLDDTIEKNVAISSEKSNIDKNKLNLAIKGANLETFINRLPNGINTIVGENGAKISGGEKQRIGIARALYRDPDILILDEATSSLDLTTEAEILKTLKNYKGKKTVLFITHRNVDKSIFNKIFELKNNIIKELN
jgi:ATP-binding cassette, subfamily B, bacterial PglK